LIFLSLYRLFPSLLDASIIFRPETLLRWHRTGFRLFWRWKSRRRVGRPALPADIRSLVRRISRENPFWGAPRIHGELLKLGIEIAQSTVAKYMVRARAAVTGMENLHPQSRAVHPRFAQTFAIIIGLFVVAKPPRGGDCICRTAIR
jgi:hypothetical protein